MEYTHNHQAPPPPASFAGGANTRRKIAGMPPAARYANPLHFQPKRDDFWCSGLHANCLGREPITRTA
jgi:hypothetical protein